MTREYTHELNKEVRSISGGYELEREETIDLDDRQVVYAVGNAMVDSSCCGVWGCRYALVPGYVVRWKHTTTADGNAVSEVQPIEDDQVKKRIIKLLESKEAVNQVRFW
jgi:hypothetical protein